MKPIQKLIILLYLIISACLLSVDARIKVAKRMHRHSTLFKEDMNVDLPQDQSPDSKLKGNEIVYFVIGILMTFPKLILPAIFLDSILDNENNPQCSSKKFQEEYDSGQQYFKTKLIPKESAEMKTLQENLAEDLGKDSESLKAIDWDDASGACEKISKLYKNKKIEMHKTGEISKTYIDFAQKVIDQDESFEEFERKRKRFSILHKDRIKLRNYMLDIFNINKEEMKIRYSNNKTRWQDDLKTVVEILGQSGEGAKIIEDKLIERKNIIHCKDFESTRFKKAVELVKKYFLMFLGGVKVAKQIFVCLEVPTLLKTMMLNISLVSLLENVIAPLLGFYVLKVIFLVFTIFRITSLIIQAVKTNKENIKAKYELYGQATGTFLNMIMTILGVGGSK